MNEAMKALGLILFGLVGTIVDYLMIRQIYNLTIVPLGAPHISLLQLLGISLFLHALLPMNNGMADKSDYEKIIQCCGKTLGIALIWLICHLIFV